MKKLLSKITLALFTVVFISLAIVNSVYAAKILLSPVTVKTTAGSSFTLNVDIDPVGENIYTVKNEIHFPADMVSVETWNYGADWTALRQPEYDKFDNNAGIIIRTAGMTNGVPTRQRFGTVVFKAKKTGTALITVNGKSFALNADGKDVYTAGNVSTISIGEEDMTKPIEVKKVKQSKSAIDLIYSSSLLKNNVAYHEPIIVVSKINNTNKDVVSVTVRSTLYTANGDAIANKEDIINAVTQSDIVQQLPTDALLAGIYSIVNEITYTGQSNPQKTTMEFNMAGEILPPAGEKIDILEMIETSPIAWLILSLLFIVGLVLGLSIRNKNKKVTKR